MCLYIMLIFAIMYTASSCFQPDLLPDSTTNSKKFYLSASIVYNCNYTCLLLFSRSLHVDGFNGVDLIFFIKYKYEAKNWLQYCFCVYIYIFHPLNSFFMRLPPNPFDCWCIFFMNMNCFAYFLCNKKFLRHLQLSTLSFISFQFTMHFPFCKKKNIYFIISTYTCECILLTPI